MNWRWLIYDYIPVELDVPKRERREIRKEIRRGFDKTGEPGVMLRLVLVTTVWMPLAISFFYLNRFIRAQNMGDFVAVLSMVAFMAICTLLPALIWRWFYKKRTLRTLRIRGYNVCSECGYLLRGLPDDQEHCPECGIAYDDMSFLSGRSKSSLWKGPEQ